MNPSFRPERSGEPESRATAPRLPLDARFRGHDVSQDGMDNLAARRARLSDVERELARLRYRHDIAMSAFRFEEATALGPTIAGLEHERQKLLAALPPPPSEAGVVPVLARPRRSRRIG